MRVAHWMSGSVVDGSRTTVKDRSWSWIGRLPDEDAPQTIARLYVGIHLAPCTASEHAQLGSALHRETSERGNGRNVP